MEYTFDTNRQGDSYMQHTTQRPATESGTLTIGGDLKVYRLGFGTMRLTGPGIWGPPADKQEALAVLRHALDLGVNLLDTADSYGPEVAESLIAEALSPYPKDLVIATKGGLLRTGPNQWPQDGRPEHLRQALEGSLRRLRLDRIDLYQLARAQKIVPIVTVQNHYNLADRVSEDMTAAESEEMIDICARQGIGFIPWSPLAAGELARQGGPL